MRSQDVFAYRKSFDLAMKIHHLSKAFPKEETYSLTDQIRRSSRSATVNLLKLIEKEDIQKIL